MTPQAQIELLEKAKVWFKDVIMSNHVLNTAKLANPKEFKINPFLVAYNAMFLTGEITPNSIARALLYPRALGTSINTSFGTNLQNFIPEVLGNAFGSAIKGVDIEFTDCLDGRKKYCQVKLGPSTINDGDVDSIHGHFRSLRKIAQTNNLRVDLSDLMVAVVYGEPGEESKTIEI